MYSSRASNAPSRRGTPPSEPLTGTHDLELDLPIINNIRSATHSPAPSSPSSTPSSTSSPLPTMADKERSSRRRRGPSEPTNSLIITPLPLVFFKPRIMAALRSHFASFSSTFLSTPSSSSLPPPFEPPIRTSSVEASPPSTFAPYSVEEENQNQPMIGDPEGDLYSWAPIQGLRRVLVTYYTAEEAEAARVASDRLFIPETPSSPAVIIRAFRATHTPLIHLPKAGLLGKGEAAGRFYDDVDSGDEGAVYESPFHLRPPKSDRNFLISPPGSPPIGWEQTMEEPPNEVALAEDLQRALEMLELKRRLEAGFEELDEEEKREGILLVPENATGVQIRVQNWSHRRRQQSQQRRKSPGDALPADWDPLDEELSGQENASDAEERERLYEESIGVREWDKAMGTKSYSTSKMGNIVANFKPAPARMPLIAVEEATNAGPSGLGAPSRCGGLGGSPAGKILPTARPPV